MVSVFDGMHTEYAQLDVTVSDLNDNAPRFREERFQKSFLQELPASSSVLTVRATDPDEGMNGFVTHWLTGGRGKFFIDPLSGVVMTTERLDPSIDEQSRYEIHVFARDHGVESLTANTTVIIDLNSSNRFTPEFEQYGYSVTVAENVRSGSSLLQISATDQDTGKDGQVVLTLATDHDGIFSMDTEGWITVSENLDFEETAYYSLEVLATDGATDSKSSSTTVQIIVTDINDNDPEFLALPEELLLKAPLNSGDLLFQVVAMDADSSYQGNNDITFSLLTHTDLFSVGAYTGEIRAANQIQSGSYDVTIAATDSGTPRLSTQATVRITVSTQISNQQPVFQRGLYRAYPAENIPTPRALIDVNARLGVGDWDVGVRYRLGGESHPGSLSIDPQMVSRGSVA